MFGGDRFDGGSPSKGLILGKEDEERKEEEGVAGGWSCSLWTLGFWGVFIRRRAWKIKIMPLMIGWACNN